MDVAEAKMMAAAAKVGGLRAQMGSAPTSRQNSWVWGVGLAEQAPHLRFQDCLNQA